MSTLMAKGDFKSCDRLNTRLCTRMSHQQLTSGKYGLSLDQPPWPRPRRLALTTKTSFGLDRMSRRTESHVPYSVRLNAPVP